MIDASLPLCSQRGSLYRTADRSLRDLGSTYFLWRLDSIAGLPMGEGYPFFSTWGLRLMKRLEIDGNVLVSKCAL